MPFSLISSIVFAGRNIEKCKNGDVGRAGVAAAQGACVTTAGAANLARVLNETKGGKQILNSVFGAKALKVGSEISKLDKFAGKASGLVNPLIVGSSVVKTLRSEDKITTGITEAGAISMMFAGEGLMKALYDPIIGNKIAAALPKPLAVLIRAGAFVAASITAYDVGKKLSAGLAKEAKANWGMA
jgi:hypothetical protein